MNKLISISIILLIILRLPTIGLISLRSDEPAYLMMNELIKQGLKPYTDFNFAHPPLLLYTAPLGGNLIMTHLILLLIQVLIMVYAYKLTNNDYAPLTLLLVFNVLNYFNFYIGLGLMTLLIITSYYYERINPWLSVSLISLALLTRLFALPAWFVLFLKTRDERYLLSVIPLALLVLFVPGFLEQVFFYHVGVKAQLLVSVKAWLIITSLVPLIPLIIGWPFKKVNQWLFLAGLLTLGLICLQNIIFRMYFSVVNALVILSLMNGLSREQSLRVLAAAALPFLVALPYHYSMYLSPVELLINESLPVTGQLSASNAVALVNGLPLVSPMYVDTCSSRLKSDWSSYECSINGSVHLLVLWEKLESDDGLWWWRYGNRSSYELLFTRRFNNDLLYFYQSKP